MKILYAGLLFISFFIIGKQPHLLPFKHDTTICDEKGIPRDSTVYYFPIETFNDSTHFFDFYDSVCNKFVTETVLWDCDISKERISKRHKISINAITDRWEIDPDTFLLNYISFTLFKMKEPVIDNYYTGNEIYRFTWLRSFDKPVAISLINEGSKFMIITKELQWSIYESHIDSASGQILPINNNIPFAINKTREISKADYLKFKKLVDSVHLFSLPHIPMQGCIVINDGADWIFEIANKEGYNYVLKHAPDDNSPYRTVGDFLIKLSGLKNEEIY